MLSNQVLVRTIENISSITGAACSVWNMKQECTAHTGGITPLIRGEVGRFISIQAEQDMWIEETYALFCVRDEDEPVYVLVMEGLTGSEKEQSIQGKLCCGQLEELIRVFKERMDRNRFYQNLLLDQVLAVDAYNQAKKLKIEIEQHRAVFIIEPKKEHDNIVMATVKGLYATGTGDFVTAVDEGHIIMVKSIRKTENYEVLGRIAMVLVDTIGAEAMVKIRVAYSAIASELTELPKAYREAQMALDVGRVFYGERSIFAYKELGIGRLLHQLPRSLCQMFLEEVFSGSAAEQFDEETMLIVNKFFENNLNISETARQLYLHRNTLMYRLEKIQKQTGLDIRTFDDAVVFKIAIMVSSHVKYTTDMEDKKYD